MTTSEKTSANLWKTRCVLCWTAASFGAVPLVSHGIAKAAEYHVAVTGSDQAGDGSLTDPWRTPSYGATQLQEGDVLSIHAGTYQVAGTTLDQIEAGIDPPANSVVRAYPGDVVILDGGPAPTGVLIGTAGRDNITIDGLVIKGLASFRDTAGSKIVNCDLSVGGDNSPGWDFGSTLFIEGTVGMTIKNNYIHDNVLSVSGGTDLGNSPGIQEYSSTGLLIENNEIARTASAGINLKDGPVDVTVRYNYIHDTGFGGIWAANQNPGNNVRIYQNIFERCNANNATVYDVHGGISLCQLVTNIEIYNNTFVENRTGSIISWAGAGMTWSAWNNISYAPQPYGAFGPYHLGLYYGASAGTTLVYSDYNYFFGPAQFRNGNDVYADLSGWRTATGFDANSRTLDPQFVSVAAKDYRRVSYPADGRGGAYATVVGAYVTGSEKIGTIPGSSAPPAADVILDNTASGGVAFLPNPGSWAASTAAPGYLGSNYVHDGNSAKGTKSVRFTPPLPATGRYDVFARWTAHTNRASNVPIDITTASGTVRVYVNQRSQGGVWVSLGRFDLHASSAQLEIKNAGTNGYVVADAVKFAPVSAP